MKILKNIVIFALPLLLIINVYRFFFTGSAFEYRGFSFIHEHMTEFNGLDITIGFIMDINSKQIAMQTMEIVDAETFFIAVGLFFEQVGLALSVPITILIDVIADIVWVLNFFVS